jgi:hypothetical protein
VLTCAPDAVSIDRAHILITDCWSRVSAQSRRPTSLRPPAVPYPAPASRSPVSHFAADAVEIRPGSITLKCPAQSVRAEITSARSRQAPLVLGTGDRIKMMPAGNVVFSLTSWSHFCTRDRRNPC